MKNFVKYSFGNSKKYPSTKDVTLYRHEPSGARVVFVDVESSMVNGYFAFPTKPTADDGLPHTLEHLTFMGSRRYPHKGFLDKVANRCLASGTNGFTQIDRTVYSVTTACQKGFVSIMPVYLDHLLHPLLTPEHFTTEIHHISSSGKDAGVVYSEMQRFENDPDELMNVAKARAVFSEGVPYRYNSGGSLPALRELCSLERIKAFHKQHYKLSNMLLLVTGRVDHAGVLSVLDSIHGDYPNNEFVRPFDDVVLPEVFKPQVLNVNFPAEEDSSHQVEVSWQGPLIDTEEDIAVSLLQHFFTDGTESALVKHFTIDNSICADVNNSVEHRQRTEIGFFFHGVDQKYIDKLEVFDHGLIKKLTDPANFSMERLKVLIDREILQTQNLFEDDPSYFYLQLLTNYQIYAPGYGRHEDNVEHIERVLGYLDIIKGLKSKGKSYWVDLINKYYTENRVIVVGKADKKLSKTVQQAEKLRVDQQIATLGPEGLKRVTNLFDNAVAINEKSAPTVERLRPFTVDSIEDVKFLDLPRQVVSRTDSTPFPVVHHESSSQFVTARLFFDLSKAPVEHVRTYRILQELFNQTDAIVDGKRMSNYDLMMQQKQDLIHSRINTIAGFNNLLSFKLIVSPDKLDMIPKWIDIWLNRVIIGNKDIKAATTQIVNDIKSNKNDAEVMMSALRIFNTTPENSVARLTTNIFAEKQFRQWLNKLKADKGSTTLVDTIGNLRKSILTCPATLHVVGSKQAVKQLQDYDWRSLNIQPGNEVLKQDLNQLFDLETKKGQTLALKVPSSDATYLHQQVALPYDYLSSEHAALSLISRYAEQLEGPLWNGVRGKGLAYGVSMSLALNHGLGFIIYRSCDLENAYLISRKIMLDIANATKLDPDLFISAKLSLICDLAESVGYIKHAGRNSIRAQLRGTPADVKYIESIARKIYSMTPEETLSVVAEPIRTLFDETKVVRSVVSNNIDPVDKLFPTNKKLKFTDLQF